MHTRLWVNVCYINLYFWELTQHRAPASATDFLWECPTLCSIREHKLPEVKVFLWLSFSMKSSGVLSSKQESHQRLSPCHQLREIWHESDQSRSSFRQFGLDPTSVHPQACITHSFVSLVTWLRGSWRTGPILFILSTWQSDWPQGFPHTEAGTW